MITEDERFIKIQGILSFSDIHPADCIKINDLIIELSKENRQLKDKIEIRNKEKTRICNQLHKYKHVIQKLKAEITKLLSINKLRKDRIDRAIECIDSLLPCIHDEELLDDLLKILKGEK